MTYVGCHFITNHTYCFNFDVRLKNPHFTKVYISASYKG